MPAISTFTDFLLATKTTRITGKREILNDAVKNVYLIGEMIRSRDETEMIRTGSRIKDDIRLTPAGSFGFYNPNAEFNPQDRDTLTTISLDWRYAKTDYGYNDETITLNEGNPEDVFVDLKHKYRMDAATDMMDGLEDALFAVPDQDLMESGAGDEPPAYSIPAFVTENGLTFNAAWTSTVMGADPDLLDRWRNQFVTYDSLDPFNSTEGIIAAFDEMFLEVKFESPEGDSNEYFENDRLRMMKIITNKDGQNLYRQALRAANDSYMGAGNPSDPSYNRPMYSGIPVKYVSTLDTALLDPATGAAYPAGKPRYFWLNCMYLFPIFHSLGYMEQVGPVPGGIRQPFSSAVYFRTWYNLFCRSRQRQGIVIPAS